MLLGIACSSSSPPLLREKTSWLGLGGTFVSTCYTHHQKSVVVDSPIPGSSLRRILAFLGGLDLTDGEFMTV